MINSVSFSGNTTNINKPKKTSPTKRGTMIGAGVGALNSAASIYCARGWYKGAYKGLLESGITKNKSIAMLAFGVVLGCAISVGVGSLIGAGIGKLVEHFKKPDTQPEVKDEKAIDKKA